ncbi:hypothetical protein SDC9_103615 [bioreactor metagenome]|uniref:Uncharacterized protein n=1 Tax=bioreactor metagenome TaxID=1076179 RepID=A0A645AUJ7_9ZZZZ
MTKSTHGMTTYAVEVHGKSAHTCGFIDDSIHTGAIDTNATSHFRVIFHKIL